MSINMVDSSGDYAIGGLRITHRGSFAILEMNRPDRLNAMGNEFWGELSEALTRLENDGRIRALIITGAGDRSFSVGGDIASFGELKTTPEKRAYQRTVMDTFIALENCPLPVIAAVNGYALGGGCELTLACDIVIASDRATFGMPESALGLVPGFGVLRAPSVIGRQMTKMMVMAGERLNAHQALQCGLIQRVVVHDHLMAEAETLAERVVANSPLAHSIGKRIINRGIDYAEFDYSVEALTVLQSSEEAAEGVSAFLEKRRPDFSGNV